MLPGAVIVDDQRFSRLPHLPDDAFVPFQARPDQVCVNTDANLLFELLAHGIDQEDKAVRCAEELACPADDRLEQLVQFQAADQAQGSVVESCQVHILALQRFLNQFAAGDIDDEAAKPVAIWNDVEHLLVPCFAHLDLMHTDLFLLQAKLIHQGRQVGELGGLQGPGQTIPGTAAWRRGSYNGQFLAGRAR